MQRSRAAIVLRDRRETRSAVEYYPQDVPAQERGIVLFLHSHAKYVLSDGICERLLTHVQAPRSGGRLEPQQIRHVHAQLKSEGIVDDRVPYSTTAAPEVIHERAPAPTSGQGIEIRLRQYDFGLHHAPYPNSV